MEGQHFYLKEWDWDVYVFYEADWRNAEDILSFMREIGCSGKTLEKEVVHLYSRVKNIGATYTNFEQRASVVVISKTTSADEFQNTYDHEKGHLAMHICEAEGIDPFSEEYQYLTGEIGRQTFVVAKKYLCESIAGRAEKRR